MVREENMGDKWLCNYDEGDKVDEGKKEEEHEEDEDGYVDEDGEALEQHPPQTTQEERGEQTQSVEQPKPALVPRKVRLVAQPERDPHAHERHSYANIADHVHVCGELHALG